MRARKSQKQPSEFVDHRLSRYQHTKFEVEREGLRHCDHCNTTYGDIITNGDVLRADVAGGDGGVNGGGVMVTRAAVVMSVVIMTRRAAATTTVASVPPSAPRTRTPDAEVEEGTREEGRVALEDIRPSTT